MILVGEHGAGKSSIMTRFADDQFKDAHEQTIGSCSAIQEYSFGQRLWRLGIER